VGRLGRGEVSRLFEPLARLEQVARQVGCAEVDAEALDNATAVDDGAAGLPKRALLVRACLNGTSATRRSLQGVGAIWLMSQVSAAPLRLPSVAVPICVAAFYRERRRPPPRAVFVRRAGATYAETTERRSLIRRV
jgi:hypothetical protein